MRLEGRVAIVTGGGSGMGRAACLRFAGEGAAVLVADIDEVAARSVQDEVNNSGGRAHAQRVDITQAVEVQAMVAEAEDRFGGVDVLYNNAGYWRYATDGYQPGITDAPSPLLTENVWDQTINVSLKGTYLGARYGIPALRRRGGGSIINCSSVAAFRVGHGASDAYTAAKGGVLAITRSLAVEHGPENIRVNCIVPGPIETPLVDRITPEARDAFGANIPLGRWGRAEDVANMALFLACSESAFCTGQTFVVDGGYLAL